MRGAIRAVVGLTLAGAACTDSAGPVASAALPTPPAVSADVALAIPEELVAALKAQVQELYLTGALNEGQARALTVKLDHVASLVAKGKDDEAKTILENFITQVNGLAGSGNSLAADQAASLTEGARELVTAIGPRIASFTTLDGAICLIVLQRVEFELVAVFSGGAGTIDHGVGPVTSGVPVVIGAPLTDTVAFLVYTLTVTSPSGTVVTAALPVRVLPLPMPVVPEFGKIESFEATPTQIEAGQAVTLLAVFGAGYGVVDNGVGWVRSGVGVTVYPTASTAYTLRVSPFCVASPSGEASVQVVVR